MANGAGCADSVPLQFKRIRNSSHGASGTVSAPCLTTLAQACKSSVGNTCALATSDKVCGCALIGSVLDARGAPDLGQQSVFVWALRPRPPPIVDCRGDDFSISRNPFGPVCPLHPTTPALFSPLPFALVLGAFRVWGGGGGLARVARMWVCPKTGPALLTYCERHIGVGFRRVDKLLVRCCGQAGDLWGGSHPL